MTFWSTSGMRKETRSYDTQFLLLCEFTAVLEQNQPYEHRQRRREKTHED